MAQAAPNSPSGLRRRVRAIACRSAQPYPPPARASAKPSAHLDHRHHHSGLRRLGHRVPRQQDDHGDPSTASPTTTTSVAARAAYRCESRNGDVFSCHCSEPWGRRRCRIFVGVIVGERETPSSPGAATGARPVFVIRQLFRWTLHESVAQQRPSEAASLTTATLTLAPQA